MGIFFDGLFGNLGSLLPDEPSCTQISEEAMGRLSGLKSTPTPPLDPTQLRAQMNAALDRIEALARLSHDRATADRMLESIAAIRQHFNKH